MENYIKKYNRYNILISLALIILSIFLIKDPTTSLNTITIIIGVIVGITGLVELITYFTSPQEIKAFSLKLIVGVITTILGVVIIINAQTINTILTWVIGAWIIIESIIKLQIAFNLKGISNSNWKIIVIFSIITFIIGLVIILNPFATLITVGKICGIMLLTSEILNIFESLFIFRI